MSLPRALAALLALTACDPSDRRDPAHPPDAGPDGGIAPDAGSEPEPRVGPDFWELANVIVPDSGVVDIRFELPRDARAFVLTARSSVPAYTVLMGLVGPEGDILFDVRDPEAGSFVPTSAENLADALPLSVLYPSARGQPMVPGAYAARLGFRAAHESDVPFNATFDVVWQRSQAPEHMAVNVWLAPGAAYDAATLITDPLWVESFAALRTIFANADIVLDPLQAFDLGAPDEDLAVADDVVLTALLLALEEEPSGGLDVVLVDRIEAEGRTVRGKTTGIPGPPAHPELARRGAVLLSLDALPASATRIAEALAHEMAHYLGLRHTTEMDGSRHDPIADTPECPFELASYQSATGAVLLSAEDCAAHDGTNLLFAMPPLDDAEQQGLSSEQAEIMRGHPLVH
jgi:hypothetical protein